MSGVLVAGLASGGVASADTGYEPTIILNQPLSVFAPQGFDDNDNAQIVVYGVLHSTCEKVGPVVWRRETASKTIFVRAQSYLYRGCFSRRIEIPYTQVVNLGLLTRGQYQVVVEGQENSLLKMAELPIGAAKSPETDDFLYAPVNHLHYLRGGPGGRASVRLSGVITNSCMIFRNVLVNIRANHVVELLPVAEYLTKDGCVDDVRPFEVNVTLQAPITARTLLHVRTLGGQSLNQVVE